MGKNRKKWLNITNALWVMVMGMLGFSACELNSPDEYGSPYARYKIKGKVIDPDNQPVSDIQIIIKQLSNGRANPYYMDTVATDIKGEFLHDGELLTEDVRIDWQDKRHGIYRHDSIDIEMPRPTGGKGWYQGESSKDITITLEKQTVDE